MKLLSRIHLPKVLVSALLVAAAFSLPLATAADSLVKFSATTEIANMSDPNSNFGSSASAKYNEVLKVQVIYDNNEDPSSTKTANNVHVKFNIPTTAGVNQTITTKTSADNVTAVNGSAKVTLDGSDAYLQYIPGTAVWAHANTAFGPKVVEQKISDAVVTDANGVNLGNENPCQAGSVTVQVGVYVPGVSVDKFVRPVGSTDWTMRSIDAKAGDTVEYLIAYKNTGNSTQTHVKIRDTLPAGETLVNGTTYLKNGNHPAGIAVASNAVAGVGLDVGDYLPGAAAYVKFQVKLPAATALQCGKNTLRNIGFAQPENLNQYFNTADVVVNKVCQTATPVYTCDAFDITADNATKKVTVSKFAQTAKAGATFKNAVINWGDNSSELTTNTVVGQNHSYKADGTYKVSAVLHFTVNGKDVTASGANCAKTVTFSTTKPPVVTPPTTTPQPPVTPVTLVNTGPGQVIGLFVATTIAGMVAFRTMVSRRLTQN